jgi:large subunit ribosomal protein L2
LLGSFFINIILKNNIVVSYYFSKITKRSSIGITSKGGRNFLGRICVFHRGGGNKRRFLYLDYYRRLNQYACILKIIKDTFHSAFIGIVLYTNGLVSNLILSEGLKIGDKFYCGDKIGFGHNVNFKIGSSIPLKSIKLFTVVNNIELFPLSGSKLVRSAGVGAILTGCSKGKSILKLTSRWQVSVDANSLASIGFVSNSQHKYISINKAGKMRALGFRPTVRGVVKNPCDHPHGGGEGKGSPPCAQVTPWGKLTKGTPTKNSKKDRLKRRLFKLHLK